MKRSIISAAVVFASAALLSGCGSSTAKTPEATQAQAQGTDAAASGKEVLRVGMECNYAPFNWTTTESNELPSLSQALITRTVMM